MVYLVVNFASNPIELLGSKNEAVLGPVGPIEHV